MSKHVIICFCLLGVKVDVAIPSVVKEISFEDESSQCGDIVTFRNLK